MNENVVILGASDSVERYSYKAFKLLKEHSHNVFLVSPKNLVIEKEKIYSTLDEVTNTKIQIDTLTIYVNPKISTNLTDSIIKLHPGRVIFNPGTENAELEKSLAENNISFERACTLVLLNTNQY